MTALLFIAALAVIVVSAELFTNAVEWAGFRMNMGSGATGSLLAALGTSLPETIVPVVALIGADPAAAQIATGAVLGAPLLLLTLGVGVTGVAVALRGRNRFLVIPKAQARRDLGTFLVAFSLVTLAMALPQPIRLAVGILLLAIYVAYVVATLRGSEDSGSMPEPLHLLRWHRQLEPHRLTISVQLSLAVAGLIAGSKLFVVALATTADTFHINALLLALVVIPFATELPETLNSVLWVRSHDDGLAFGNVAGSATFQACVLGFIGLVFTPWQPGGGGLLSAVLTLLTAAGLLALLRNGRGHGVWLILAAAPWLIYLGVAIASAGRIGAPPG